MKKAIYVLLAVFFVLGTMAIWSCNNGGGESTCGSKSFPTTIGDTGTVTITVPEQHTSVTVHYQIVSGRTGTDSADLYVRTVQCN